LSTTVLQDSVATRMNHGKIFNALFIANLLLSVMVKEFWRSVRIWQSYGKKLSGTFFFRTQCTYVQTTGLNTLKTPTDNKVNSYFGRMLFIFLPMARRLINLFLPSCASIPIKCWSNPANSPTQILHDTYEKQDNFSLISKTVIIHITLVNDHF